MPIHRDTPGRAVRDDVVRRYGYENVVVRGIHGDGMRGPSRVHWQLRWHIKRRHQLQHLFVLRVDHAEDRGTLGRRWWDRGGRVDVEWPQRAGGRGGVVIPISLVEPDLVPNPDAQYLMLVARDHIQNDLDRRRGQWINRRPQFTRRIEDRIAADEHVFIGAKGEAGRRAELDPICVIYLFRRRINAYDRSVLCDSRYLRNGEIELFGAGIPDRLFDAVGRVYAMVLIKDDPVSPGAIRRGEFARRCIEPDECAERWGGSVVDRQDQRIPGVHR